MTPSQRIIDSKAKQAALEHLLAQPGFRASPRNKKFLRFVVEESLAGRGDRLKAYTIAVDVFSRGVNFDGMLDPVVRIEAGRLRQALASYYAEPGRSDPVRISLPRGGYEPLFELSDAPGSVSVPDVPDEAEAGVASPDPLAPALTGTLGHARAVGPRTRRRWQLAVLAIGLIATVATGFAMLKKAPEEGEGQAAIVLVAQTQPLSHDPPTMALGHSLTVALPAAISRFEGLSVIAGRPDQRDQDLIASTIGREAPSRRVYLVTASVRAEANGARAFWELSDARNQAILWSGSTDTPFARNTTNSAEDEIAAKIAGTIADRRGVIMSFERKALQIPPPPGYACVTRARTFSSNLTDALRAEAMACLEKTVAQIPDYVDAWALLAYVYADESRSRSTQPDVAKAALDKAQAAAARAGVLAPYSSLMHLVTSVVAYQAGDIARFEAAGKRAIAINPGDPGLQVVFANRLFAAGRYDEAVPILKGAIGLRPAPVPMDQMTLIMDHYRRKDYDAALTAISTINMPNFYYYWVLVAAINGQLGRQEQAVDAVKNLLNLRPNYGAGMRMDFRNRRLQDDFAEHVADGLRKAGLDAL
ncbi:hypothetical protein DWF00_04315 [Bosea caraganae]|uniref:Adenylate cyclase n=1 Tax=Bosea caraganae TaxID=2763117 RepID=A0A370KYY5_9HYPH|nr:hypothetical protein [Bosea caraganae]RDJ19822.1 hypothetical protein DWE98_27805 [Bosea caraganae]RDJ30037.1 hypothetical protein DWF00_04315 [Bosea caraganae]